MIEKGIINAIVALIELVCVYELCRRITNEKKANILVGSIFAILYLSFAIIATMFINNKLSILLINLTLLLFFTYIFKIKFYKRILAVSIYIVFSMAFEILTMLMMAALFHISVDNLQSNLELYLLAAVISKFALFLNIKTVLIFVKPSNSIVDIKYGLLNLILPIATLGMLIILSNMVFISNKFDEKIRILSVAVLLIFSNFSSFIIYEYSVKNKIERERQRTELLVLNERQAEYVHLIEQQLRSNKEIHDFKHKMYKIKIELGENKSNAARIVDELCEIFEQKELIEFTGIADVDALLNVKKKKAFQDNIELKYHIILSDEILIDSMDVCVIIGNILDNAMEHMVKSKDNNVIELRMLTTNNYLAISSNNNADIKNVTIGKSKKVDEYKFHGYGLSKIEELTKKYLGNMDYRINNNKFEINITLNNCISHLKNG